MSAYTDPSQCKVALLCGGTSGEREVSLNSGKGAQEALLEAGFDVTMLDTANKSDLMVLLREHFDVAFLALHGAGGEDGTIQGMLEILGIPYIGSDVAASSLAINKAKAKMVYVSAGIPTPASAAYTDLTEVDFDEIIQRVGMHCVVKACFEGSSNGIYMIEDRASLEEAVKSALDLDGEVLIEQYVAGDEYTVAVVGNKEIESLPVIQIVPASDYYDYEAKYAPGGSKHLCPAPISEELTSRLQDLAVRAHKALGCSGVSRSDFIVDSQGNAWILETNTIPGMTKTSLLPDAARAKGYTFAELAKRLIDLAFEKHKK